MTSAGPGAQRPNPDGASTGPSPAPIVSRASSSAPDVIVAGFCSRASTSLGTRTSYDAPGSRQVFAASRVEQPERELLRPSSCMTRPFPTRATWKLVSPGACWVPHRALPVDGARVGWRARAHAGRGDIDESMHAAARQLALPYVTGMPFHNSKIALAVCSACPFLTGTAPAARCKAQWQRQARLRAETRIES